MDKREYDSQYARESYRWYKAHGICVGCKRRDAIKGRVHCPECAAKSREHMRGYMQKVDPVKRREYMREYMRAYRKAERDLTCISRRCKSEQVD